ncbi:MAG: LuxR C-terminal-related transcriptional regulator [Syntrophobacteraceae bacterium]
MSVNRTQKNRATPRTLVYPDNISGIEFLLSRRAAATLLEIIHASLSCDCEEDLVSLFRKIQILIPFDFAFTGLTKLDNDGRICSHNIINISYPDEWLKIYEEREFQKVDVIVKENFTAFRPQYWSETYKKNTPPKYFISLAEDFGLKEGYTHGLMTPGHSRRASLLSFSGNFDKYDEGVVAILKLLVPHLHQALCHIHSPELPQDKGDLISSREKEVLGWLKQGKSSWEISVILNISERTVNFHIYNIMQKLEAVNRPHAVAVAASLGLIEFD